MLKKRKLFIVFILLLSLVFSLSGAAFADAAEEAKVEVLTEALDYSNKANWAYFADGGEEKSADVFFIAPLVDTRSYANSVDLNDKLKERFLSAIDAEKDIYDGSCRFYSPYYRQVSLNGYLLEGEDHDQAMKNAYLDISAAFRYYLDNENNGRAIVLAGFSQGAQMSIELLKEYYGGESAEAKALRERLVTVYAIGISLTEEETIKYPQIVPANGEGENGTVIMFDCEDGTVKNSIFIPEGKKGISINPLNWKTDATPADKSENKGAVINGETIPELCGCYIDADRGALIVTDITREQYQNPIPQLFEEGSLHVYDHMFFHTNLKENLELRVKNFEKSGAATSSAFDINYLLSLQSLREKAPKLGSIGEKFCELNVLLLPAVCVFLYIAVDKRLGRVALINYGASEIANLFVKNTACVPRPYMRDARIVPVKTSSSYSFPSGHTMYATSIYGSIGAWQNKKHRWITALCIALMLLTGFTRNFVGAHTPQDVVVSIVLTLAVMFGITHLVFFLEKHKEKTELFMAIGALIGLAVLLYANFKTYKDNGFPAASIQKAKTEVFASFGRWIGLLAAIFIDRRFIRYEVNKKNNLRFAFGIAGALVFIGATLAVSKLGGFFATKTGGLIVWFSAYIIALAAIPAAAKKLFGKK